MANPAIGLRRSYTSTYLLEFTLFLFFLSALSVEGATQSFSYSTNAVQSYTIPIGTQYLDFTVVG